MTELDCRAKNRGFGIGSKYTWRGEDFVASQITISYDLNTDLLEISLGAPCPAISQEVIPDLFMRYDLKTFDEETNQGQETVGFTISNVSLWSAEDFLRLADVSSNGTLKHIIQWIQEDLVGKTMELQSVTWLELALAR